MLLTIVGVYLIVKRVNEDIQYCGEDLISRVWEMRDTTFQFREN